MSSGQTLIDAASSGDVGAVHTLLSGSAEGVAGFINEGDQDGMAALYCASAMGHLEMVRLLLEKGADIDAEKKVRAIRAVQVRCDVCT